MVDFYRFAVYLGFAGLACMAVLGVANSGGGGRAHSGGGHSGGGHAGGGHAGGHAGGGHAGPGHGHGGPAHAVVHGAPAHGHVGAGHAGAGHGGIRVARGAKGARGSRSGSRANFFLSLLSPQTFFSMMLGFGATGVLIKHAIPIEPFRAGLSVAGGLLFEKCLIAPVWNGWMRFASTPARTLESAVYEEATAVTAFDAEGCGLISIDLSGHEVRVLARLNAAELQNPQRVRAGDRLFIESINTARNSCVVSRLQSV